MAMKSFIKLETATERATRASAECYEFVKRREAKKINSKNEPVPANKAYEKPGDPVTIGFGHTGPIETAHGRRKPVLGDVITTDYAHQLFEEDAAEAEALIDVYMGDIVFTQGQRDAMFSFVFNIARKWLDPKNNTFLRHWKKGTLTFDILLEYLPQYRNERTIFEEGLFRRRLAELCMVIGVPPLMAERIAWEALLRRDKDTNEITHMTDPLLVVLKAEAAAKEAGAITTSPSGKLESSSSPALETGHPTEPAAAPDPDPIPESQPHGSGSGPSDEVTIENDQGDKAVEKVNKKALKYPKPPAQPTDETPMTRPEFWTMNLLMFGRIGLAVGVIPAFMTDLITDPNFQAAVGGILAIYAAMLFKWRNDRKRADKEKVRHSAEMTEALDGLRQQYDARIIDFYEYEAQVRELTT